MQTELVYPLIEQQLCRSHFNAKWLLACHMESEMLILLLDLSISQSLLEELKSVMHTQQH